MPTADFIKEIDERKLKAIQARLKKEKATQKHTDSKNPKLSYTLLHYAVQSNDVAIVNAFIEAGADATAVDSEGATPLHWASLKSNKEAATIAGTLIKKKANVNASNNVKESPLHVAAAQGNCEVAEVLLAATGVKVDDASPGFTAVHAAARAGSIPVLTLLTSHGAKLNAKDASGLTPLLALLKSEAPAASIASVLKLGDCELEAQDPSSGRTALYIAALKEPEDAELLSLLLDAGASVDTPDSSGDTPAMALLRKGRPGIAVTLLKKSKKLGYVNKQGESLLSLALSLKQEAVAGEVIAAGLDLSSDGPRLLKSALEAKNDSFAAKLIQSLSSRQLESMSLDFKSLAAAGLPMCAAAFLKASEQDEFTDAEGNTALHTAASESSEDVASLISALLAMGLKANAANKEGDTALHIAAKAGNLKACEALVAGGCDPLARNKRNRTPRGQAKVAAHISSWLCDIEEAAKVEREQKTGAVWGGLIQSTQTESAFGVRVV